MKNLLLGIIAINLTIISINLTLRSVEPAYAQLSSYTIESAIDGCFNFATLSRNANGYVIRTEC